MSRAGYLVAAGDPDVALGPERRVLRPSASGHRALARSLGRADWSTQRPPPPFVTWMVLAWQATSKDFVEQVRRRHRFLSEQIEEDRAALAAVIAGTPAGSGAPVGGGARFGPMGNGDGWGGRGNGGQPAALT